MTLEYPFADIELARRLERTEARANVQFVEARAEAFPDAGATWTAVAETYAMFDGVGSPVTQTFGLGVFQLITEEDMDQLEDFFKSRGAAVFHEVCPLADPSTFKLLSERGYKPIEVSNVLYRPISPDLRLAPPLGMTKLKSESLKKARENSGRRQPSMAGVSFPKLHI